MPVAGAFTRWELGELGSGELSDIIHRFHQGPARELFDRYNNPHLELAVAHAITVGILDRQTIPAELLDHLARRRALRESAGDTMRPGALEDVTVQ